MSEKSPILKAIKLAQTQLDKMNLRERLLVVGTALLVLGTTWYVGLMEPALKAIKKDRAEVAAVRQRIESVNQSLATQTEEASRGAIGYREQYTLVQRRLEELNEKLGGYTAELIGPGKWRASCKGCSRSRTTCD